MTCDYEIIGPPGATGFLLCPRSQSAREYLIDLIAPEALWIGPNLTVEPHYLSDLVGALIADTFIVEYQGQRVVGVQPNWVGGTYTNWCSSVGENL